MNVKAATLKNIVVLIRSFYGAKRWRCPHPARHLEMGPVGTRGREH